MKFLYFGDFHERAKPPISRIDDWQKTINDKVTEIKALAATHNVRAMLQPGDFLDTPKISDEFLYQVIGRWSNLNMNRLMLKLLSGEMSIEEIQKEIENNIPLLGVVGNHELFGLSMKSFNKTSLSLLSQIGFMNLVTKENPIIFKSDEGFTVAITGANYHADIDRDGSHKDYLVEKKLGDFHIHLVHGFGTIQDFGNLMPHTKVQELGSTEADLTIIGHDHIGFDPIEVNGKWFVNPGAPVRLSNDPKEMARQPKIMIIDIGPTGIKLDLIPLKTAQDSQLVLDRSRIETKHEQQEKLEGIKETIKNANIGKGENIVEIIDQIANNRNIDDDIRDDVRELISKKAENLTVQSKTPGRYYIKSLELENFQSHEHSLFEFSPGLNVLTGESRSGKTAIIRALGWIYEDYGGASRRFIKTGAKHASATITLDNGLIIQRVVEAKAGGFNGYRVFYPSKNEWEVMNTKAINVIQELLGYTPLQIDKTDTGKTETIPLNFLRQGNSWFFIGDDTTGSQRAKIIGTICGTNIADAAIREVESKNKELGLLLKNADKEILSLDIEVGCMVHVEQMESVIGKAEKLMEELNDLMEQQQILLNGKQAIESLKQQAVTLKAIESDLKGVNDAKKVLAKMVELSEQKETILDVREKLSTYGTNCTKLETIIKKLHPCIDAQRIVRELISITEQKALIEKYMGETASVIKAGVLLKKFMKNIPDVEGIKEKLNELKELHDKKTLVVTYQSGVAVNQQQQQVLGSLINNLKNVDSAKKTIHDIALLVEQKKSLFELRDAKVSIDNSVLAEEKIIRETDKEIKAVKLEYMDVFSRVEKCPLCLHDITRDDAISIAKNKFTKD